jgi:hypothetical protein
MPNLLEALQPQIQDTTSQLSTLLRAKSGKAVGGPATALSTQQEQAALAQTAQAMQPVQQAAQIQQTAQQQQARDIQQKTVQQQAEIAQSRQANKMQSQLRTDQLLQELEQGRGKLDAAKYQANLEQIGQNLRLSNQQYIDNLQREGNKARLNDQSQFLEQLNKSIFEDNKLLLEKQLGDKSIISANDREFKIAMERMGNQMAWNIFQNELKAEQERQTATAVGGLVTAGVGAYGQYASNQAAATRGTNVERTTSPFGQDQTNVTLSGAIGRQS